MTIPLQDLQTIIDSARERGKSSVTLTARDMTITVVFDPARCPALAEGSDQSPDQ